MERLWNSLPEDQRAAEKVDIFKSKQGTYLFSLAFDETLLTDFSIFYTYFYLFVI